MVVPSSSEEILSVYLQRGAELKASALYELCCYCMTQTVQFNLCLA